MYRKLFNAVGFVALMTLLASSRGFATSTQDTWHHHIEAWEARSVKDIVSDYSEDSTLIINNQVFRGREQIAQVFTQLFEIFDGGINRIDTPVVHDRFVYITWHYAPTADHEFFGTDTFVVESGTIVLQTIASPLYNVYPVK